jgi:hypothetical protein
MAKKHYSADSAPLPQPPSGMGLFKTLNMPASCLTDALPVITTFVVRDTNAYVGESLDLGRRLSEHVSARRKARPSGIPTPVSID